MTGRYAQVIGVFHSGPVRQRPKRRHRQHKPVSRHPFGVGSSCVLPLPSDALERPKAQLYPEPKPIPAHSCFSRREIGHNHPRLFLASVPDDDHRSSTAFARGCEGCPCPNICVAWSGYERPRGQAGSPIRAEHGVDRLPHVRMPSHRAYLIPQFRAPQSPVTHYQHGHVLRHRFGQDAKHVHYRFHPLAGRVGGHDAPGKGNGAASVDCAYHDRGRLIALHCRVYGKHQPVRLPQLEQPLQQRDEARVHIQLYAARVGAVLAVVEPLSEVLPDAVEAADERKHRGDGVLATAPSQYGAVHPENQSFKLGLSEVRHVVFDGLMHLIPFGWEAHGKSLAPFCWYQKDARKPCAFQGLILISDFAYPCQPVKGEEAVRPLKAPPNGGRGAGRPARAPSPRGPSLRAGPSRRRS